MRGMKIRNDFFLFQLSKNPIPEDAAIAGLDFIMSKMDDLKLEHLLFEVRIKI